MARASVALSAATIIALSLIATAQQPPATPPAPPAPQQDIPTFRAGTNIVRVDVVATDKTGTPIVDLKPEDFEVFEDGDRQRIETFRLLSIEEGTAEANSKINNSAFDDEEAARDDIRVFGVFLDDYSVSPRGGRTAAEEIAHFLETEMSPSDMIGIMDPTMPLADVRINRDHAGAARALRRFVGRRGNPAPVNAAEANQRATRVAPRLRREASLSALKAFIMRLGSLKEGRKSLILVTEGYGGDSDTYFQLRLVTDLASRYNTAIYPVNPQIRPPSSLPSETLEFLAGHSGGRVIEDRTENVEEYRERTRTVGGGNARPVNGAMFGIIGQAKSKIAPAMNQILVDASANYLIGYRSPLEAPDDKLHKIEVKVKRRGVDLRYRQRWWAMKPDVTPRTITEPPLVASPQMQTALTAVVTPRGRSIRTWVGMSRGGDGRTRVTFVAEPISRTATGVMSDGEQPARVLVTATSADGARYSSGSALDTTGAVLDIPPGTVELRWSVENAQGTVLDNETRALTVADFSTPQIMFGTPVLLRARTSIELQRLKVDPQPRPSAISEFARSDRLLIRVPVYNPPSEPLTAQLVTRGGRLMLHLAVAPTAAPGAMPEVEVPLASLPPDDYAILFSIPTGPTGSTGPTSPTTLTGPTSPTSPTAVVAFRVVN